MSGGSSRGNRRAAGKIGKPVPINRGDDRAAARDGRALSPVDRHEEHHRDEREDWDELARPGHRRVAVRDRASRVTLDAPSAPSRGGGEQHD